VTPLLLGLIGLLLAGPVPAVLGRSRWLLPTPRAGVVLWQSLALAAVLAIIGAGFATTVWMISNGQTGPFMVAAHVVVIGLTSIVVVRLAWASAQVALDTRARRRRHRDLVDVLGDRDGTEPGLRILAHDTPMAYCLPALGKNRVVVSAGALSCLAGPELEAVLAHEQAHVRARHDLVLEAFSALHTAFPRGVRSKEPLLQAQLMVEMLADDAARSRAGAGPLARALVALAGQSTPAGALGVAAGSVALRLERLAAPVHERRVRSAAAYMLAVAVLVLPTVFLAVPWMIDAWALLS